MSGGSRFLAITGSFFVILVGVWVIVATVGDPEWAAGVTRGFEAAAGHWLYRWLMALAGGLMAVLVLVLPFLGAGYTRREKAIEFTGEAGTMIIEVTALEDCLRRTVLEDEDATDANCVIKVPEIGQEEPIVCNLNVGIKERPNIPGKGNELMRELRERFLEILPMDTPPIVNIRIRIQRPRPTVTSRFAAVKAEEEPLSPEAPTQPFEPVKVPEAAEDEELQQGQEETPVEEDLPVGPFTGEMKYPVGEEGEEEKKEE